MGVTTFGHKRLRKAINRWGDGILDDVKRIVAETAYLLQAEARARAAEDTGYLKQAIEVEFSNNGLTATVTSSASYSIFIEFGTGIYSQKGTGRKDGWTYYSEKYGQFIFTVGSKAQPFWMPSIEVAQKHFKKEMKKLGR